MGAKMNEVGGLPIFYFTTYGDPSSASVTVALPAGFYPDYVRVIGDETTNPIVAEWHKGGNATPGGVLHSTTGTKTLMTVNGINVASGLLTIGTDVVNSGIGGAIMCWRYSQ